MKWTFMVFAGLNGTLWGLTLYIRLTTGRVVEEKNFYEILFILSLGISCILQKLDKIGKKAGK